LHIQQIRPYIEDTDMMSIHFDCSDMAMIKIRDKLLFRFDEFISNFKSTKFYVPDKDLHIRGLTNPHSSGFKVGEYVKEEFWGKSLENQLKFLNNLDQYTVFVMMKKFFFQHGTIMSTTIADKLRCYMYNNVYWEELTTNLAEIRGNKFDVMYQWLFKEWDLIKSENNNSGFDNVIRNTFQVSSDKQIYMIKCKIETNIRRLHDMAFKNCVFQHFKDETYKPNIDFDTHKHLFAFEDCVYDLRDRCFKPSDCNDFVSCTCGYEYNDKSIRETDVRRAHEDIMKFMSSILSNPEEEASAVLMVIASWLGDLYNWEKGWFFLGNGGNGKGALFELIIRAFGNYRGELQVEFWTTRDQVADRPNSALFKVRNARLIYTNEPDTKEGSGHAVPFIDGKFKQMTGGDEVSVRELHGTTVQFKAGSVAFLLNNLAGLFPGIQNDQANAQAIRRRVEIIKLPFTFTDDQNKINENPNINKLIDYDLKNRFSTPTYRKAFIDILFDSNTKLKESINPETKMLELPESMKSFKEAFFKSENMVARWFENTLAPAIGFCCDNRACKDYGTIYATKSSTKYPTYMRFDTHNRPVDLRSDVEFVSECAFKEVEFLGYGGNPYEDDEFKLTSLLRLFKQNTAKQDKKLNVFKEELKRIVGQRSKNRNEHKTTKGVYSKSNVWYLQGYDFIDKD